jgi:membrane associated rhomboid family serine protease
MIKGELPSFESIYFRSSLVKQAVVGSFVRNLKRYPLFTTSLVMAIIAVHLMVFALEQSIWDGRILGPFPDMRTKALLVFGARFTPAISAGEPWRLISCIFLHGDIMHLGLNMVALFGLGRICEAVYGPVRLSWLLLISGLSGSALSMYGGTPLSVGASGAVFGLLGAGVVFGLRYRHHLEGPLKRVFGRGLMPWVILNISIGLFVPQIDNLGHLGGLAGGAIMALILGNRVIPSEQGSRGLERLMSVLVIGLTLWTVFMMSDWRLILELSNIAKIQIERCIFIELR